MIQAKTPIVKKPQQTVKKQSEFFVVSNNIIPLRRYTHDSISRLEENPTEIVVSKTQVKKLIVQHKQTNPISKFFKRVSRYLTNLERFLRDAQKLYRISIVQKKILLFSEKTEQALRVFRAKRMLKEMKEGEEKAEKKRLAVDLGKDDNLAGLLAIALGISAAQSVSQMFGPPTQIYGDVVGKGEFVIDETETEAPAWIPFPKGTTGLVFTSGYKMRWGRPHKGIDIASATVGKPIITPITGVVTAAGWDSGGYGYKVIVKSGQLEMLFGHLMDQPPVRTGQNVKAGTVIGYLGSTGRSTGPHLHWEVIVNGSHVDPSAWTKSNPPGTSTAGATTKLNAKPMEPPNHPSRKGGKVRHDFDGRVKNNESEGGINFSRKIMIGEAGVEFRIPMSQMPLFVQAMMEEKIRSMNPLYQVSQGFESNIKTSSATAETTFASGGIAGTPEFWKIVAIASREDSLHPQGQADVAQSLYNRSAIGSYPGGKDISKIITAPGQYQPTFTNPAAWNSIKDKKSAIAAAGKGAGPIDMALKSITDPSLQREAQRFVGGRTDFMGESQKPNMKPGDITRGKNHNFFGWFYDARLPKPAPIPSSVKSVAAVKPQPKSKPKAKELNLIDKFILWINPPKSQKVSLNQIDGSTQMQVVNDYQNELVLDNDIVDITFLYKPTVKVPAEIA